MYIYLLYPFICWWTLRLLPHLGYCEQCCYERWGVCIFSFFFPCLKIHFNMRNKLHQNNNSGASLVAQWLRIRLPMQGTRVRALVQEDPICCRETKPLHHNYWACVPQLLKPTHLEPVLHHKRRHHNEKPAHHNEE